MLGAVEHSTDATQSSVELHVASGRGGYLGQMKREVGIAPGQGKAWEGFASSLKANTRRLSGRRSAAPRAANVSDLAFGDLPDRLAALAAMKLAAADLLAVLTPAQRRRAARLLPLCCLPDVGRR